MSVSPHFSPIIVARSVSEDAERHYLADASGYHKRWRPTISLALLLVALGGLLAWCRAGGRLVAEIRRPDNVSADESAAELAHLARRGDFVRFASRALSASARQLTRPAVLRLQAEAFLALGLPQEAEQVALRACRHAARPADSSRADAIAALKIWTTARCRQGLALESDTVDQLLPQSAAGEPRLQALRFWRDQLRGRPTFQVAGDGSPVTVDLKQSTAWAGLAAHRVEGVEIAVNGVPMPLAIIDTGAEHTLITSQAAEAAGVKSGPAATELVGFVSATARPAVIDELRIGTLLLHNVPVLVCDSRPLVVAKGAAALGIDLLHHLRVTIDYPKCRARFEPAIARRDPVAESTWQIPLWTFSQACLAQARLPSGLFARTMLDTGNRVGAYASPQWARASLPGFYVPSSPLLPWFKHRKYEIVGLELGSRTLPDWPVQDRLPEELARLDLIDLLLGHDLLARWAVTIDLRGRLLQLRPSEARSQGSGVRSQ